MTGRVSRRELLLREIPRALAAGCVTFGGAGVLAEPIRRVGLNEFSNQLLIQHWEKLLKTWERELSDFCQKHGLKKDEGITHAYVAASFFHELIRRNGILGNRYMLIGERQEKVLRIERGILRPLEEDELGLRGPGRMLSDMFSGKPRYMLESGKKIHCFGDCDEYEMAYVTILRAVGVEARVVMTGTSHVKTQLEIGGKRILVDNTRNIFGKEDGCKKCRDYRTGDEGFMEPWKARRYVRRINRLAAADANVRIWPKGEERVDNAIARWEESTGISEPQEGTGLSPSSQTGHTKGEGK